jgi:hypothetical protein
LKLAEKEPRFLLSALKSVIEMIEAEEEPKNKGTPYYPFCEATQRAVLCVVHVMNCFTTLPRVAVKLYFSILI